MSLSLSADPLFIVANTVEKWTSINETKRLHRIQNSTGYNPLFTLGLNENMHSRLLADLFSPTGSHGQGTHFLDLLLKSVNLFQAQHPSSTWKVTPSMNYIDIHLEQKPTGLILVIENKCCGAIDQPNQLYRYWRNIREANPDRAVTDIHVIYLGGSEETHPSEQSLAPPPEEAATTHERVPKEALHRLSLANLTNTWLEHPLPHPAAKKEPSLALHLRQYHEFWTLNMKTENAQTAAEAFDTIEKWTAFNEVRNQYDEIRDQWLATGAKALRETFTASPSIGWDYLAWDNSRDTLWYLREFGSNSISIGFGWLQHGFYLVWPGADKTKTDKARQLLIKDQYLPLSDKFGDRDNRTKTTGVCLLADELYNPFNGNPQREAVIAWHAKHKTQLFAQVMATKIREITDDSNLTRLICELNIKLKIPRSKSTH